jgi:hypothetical protein
MRVAVMVASAPGAERHTRPLTTTRRSRINTAAECFWTSGNIAISTTPVCSLRLVQRVLCPDEMSMMRLMTARLIGEGIGHHGPIGAESARRLAEDLNNQE